MSRCAPLFIAACVALAAFVGCETFERYGAPRFEDKGPHKGAKQMTEGACFSCHADGKDGAPKAPKSMYGKKDCTWCHLSG